MENKLNLKLKRLPIIKGLIYKNIKILEDITIAKIDREISRELITEEVDCLIKDFLYIKIFGTTKQVLCFQTNMREPWRSRPSSPGQTRSRRTSWAGPPRHTVPGCRRAPCCTRARGTNSLPRHTGSAAFRRPPPSAPAIRLPSAPANRPAPPPASCRSRACRSPSRPPASSAACPCRRRTFRH